MRKIELTTEYQPLLAGRFVASVTLSAIPSNSGNVFFRGDDGADVPWLPGEWHRFVRINLSEVYVKGTPGDTLTVIGGTW